MIRRPPLIPVAVLLAVLSLGPARGQDEAGSLRDRLIRRIDARLEVEMQRVRAALIEEIDAVLAEEGEAVPMPDAYARLLEEAESLRERLTAPRATTAPSAGTGRTILGADVSPAPGVLVSQLGLRGNVLIVDRVPEGSAAQHMGWVAGDLLRQGGDGKYELLRKGKPVPGPAEGEDR